MGFWNVGNAWKAPDFIATTLVHIIGNNVTMHKGC